MGNTGKYVTFLVLFLTSISGIAQNAPYDHSKDPIPDAPSQVRLASLSPADTDPVSPFFVRDRAVMPMVAIAVRPPARVADKRFWMVNGLHLLWTVADVEITAAGMRNDPTCREYNPFVPRRPSRAMLYVSNLPEIIGATYLSYRAKKKGTKRWYWAPALAGSFHAIAFAWDATGSTCLRN